MPENSDMMISDAGLREIVRNQENRLRVVNNMLRERNRRLKAIKTLARLERPPIDQILDFATVDVE